MTTSLYNRQEYKDFTYNKNGPGYGSSGVQIKYDGIWCRCEVTRSGQVTYYSRNNKVKHRAITNHATSGVYIGEFMYGSQWSQDETRKGYFYVFDVPSIAGTELVRLPYWKRLSVLKEARLPAMFRVVKTMPLNSARELWKLVQEGNIEGLIWRDMLAPYNATILRTKPDVVDDYYITDVVEGKKKNVGRLGSFAVSSERNGPLLMYVGGGFTDTQRKQFWQERELLIGRCVTIAGKLRFESGALRHPTFKGFHNEK